MMMQEQKSLANWLSSRSPTEQAQILSNLSPKELEDLKYNWKFWGRPNQIAPGTIGAESDRTDWVFWLLLAGRGFGKTRAGAQFCIDQARNNPGSKGILVGATISDAHKVMLSLGQESALGASGILAISPPDFMPVFNGQKNLLTWPNGSVAEVFSAEVPSRLRGPQASWIWVDELAAWQYPEEAWSMLMYGFRIGKSLKACITTTPRAIPIIKDLLKNPATVITKGSSYDNKDNLSQIYYDTVIAPYEGTRLGRQEIYAEILDDNPGALWKVSLIDILRIKSIPMGGLRRIVVSIDPAASKNNASAETGIIVAGIGECFCLGKSQLHGFVLDDQTCSLGPDDWGQIAVRSYHQWKADRVVAEVNQGGNMVEHVIRTVDANCAYKPVRAKDGKRTRAEPISAMYEQKKIHHVGSFPKLEDQLTTWDPITSKKSPDRLDALVWAFTELFGFKTADPLPTAYNFGGSPFGQGPNDDDDRWNTWNT